MCIRCSGVLLFACAAIAFTTAAWAEGSKTKRVLLLGQGPDGHPAGTHEYTAGMRILAKCLEKSPGLQTSVEIANDPWTDGPELLRHADGVVLFVSQGAKWIHDDSRRHEAFAQLAQRGGGLVVIHWGMGTRDAKYIDGFLKLFGGCHGGPDRKYQVVKDAAVQIVDAEHPICAGVRTITVDEEFYYRLKFVNAKPGVTPVLRTKIDGNLETVAWAWNRPDGGRSFGFSGCHFHENWRREEYRRLLAQAVLWTVNLPVPPDGLPVAVDGEVFKLK